MEKKVVSSYMCLCVYIVALMCMLNIEKYHSILSICIEYDMRKHALPEYEHKYARTRCLNNGTTEQSMLSGGIVLYSRRYGSRTQRRSIELKDKVHLSLNQNINIFCY
jgi:hypothetical protein